MQIVKRIHNYYRLDYGEPVVNIFSLKDFLLYRIRGRV